MTSRIFQRPDPMVQKAHRLTPHSGSESDSGSGSDKESDKESEKKDDDSWKKCWTVHVLTKGSGIMDVYLPVTPAEGSQLQKLDWSSVELTSTDTRIYGSIDKFELVQLYKTKLPFKNKGTLAELVWKVIESALSKWSKGSSSSSSSSK